MKRISLTCASSLLVVMMLAGGACSKTPPTPQVIIDLAPIHEVTLSLMKSNPAQIGAHIKGGLRDGCTTFNNIEITREGNTLNLKVTTKHPKDTVCPAIYGYFEKDVNLGSDFTIGTTYTINVNDYVAKLVY